MLGKFQRKVTRSAKGEIKTAPHWQQGYTFYGYVHALDDYVEEIKPNSGITIRIHKLSSITLLKAIRK